MGGGGLGGWGGTVVGFKTKHHQNSTNMSDNDSRGWVQTELFRVSVILCIYVLNTWQVLGSLLGTGETEAFGQRTCL